MGSAGSTPASHRHTVPVSGLNSSSIIQQEDSNVNSIYNDTENKPTSRHVGLENRVGENNCFLNATIQALWHLNFFREKVLHDEQAGGDENIDLIFSTDDKSSDARGAFCSLFSQYQFTEEMCIPPTEIRQILAQLDPTERVKIGDIADAAETLETLLSLIHVNHVSNMSATSVTNSIKNDFCRTGTTKCISHSIFGGVFVSQSTCQFCRATNEPTIVEPFFHYATVLALLGETSTDQQTPLSFGHLLHLAFRNAAVECPSREGGFSRPVSDRSDSFSRDSVVQKCTGRADVDLSCLESPMVFAVSLAWPSDSVHSSLIQRLLDCMEEHILLSEVFFSQPSPMSCQQKLTSAEGEKYLFRGFVCFYGKHYISIFREWNSQTKSCDFLLFDDAHIRRLGSWESVKEECVKSRYQPVLLLFEKQTLTCTKLSCK